MYETLYDLATTKNADITMCACCIDDGEQVTSGKFDFKAEYSGHDEIVNGLLSLYARRYHDGLYSVCNKLFRNEMIKNNQIRFDENLLRAEDAWFVFDALKVAAEVRTLDAPLYYYRMVPNSVMHSSTSQTDRYERSRNFRKKVISECEALGISIDENEFNCGFIYETFTYCREMVIQHHADTVKKILNDKCLMEACNYAVYLPKHVKVLCFFESRHKTNMVMNILKLWSHT